MPAKIMSIASGGNEGSALKVMKRSGPNNEPVGSVIEFKSSIVTVVPSSPAKDPVEPGPIVASIAVKGLVLSSQLIVLGVTSIVPAILKLPLISGLSWVHVSPANAAAKNIALAFMFSLRVSDVGGSIGPRHMVDILK